MEEEFDEILQKTAEYVEASQAELGNLRSDLQKRAAAEQAYNLQAQRTAAILADRGCLRPEKVNDFVDKLASNPLEALKTVEKLAKLVESNSLGGPSSVKQASVEGACPFELEFFPERFYNNSGLVD